MMNNKLILGLGLAVVLSGCSTTKNLNSLVVPEGSDTAVEMTAKKGAMSEEEIKAWPHADLMQDSIPGMSLDKAYAFLADKKGTTVILGVVDSGIDIEHEDLEALEVLPPSLEIHHSISSYLYSRPQTFLHSLSRLVSPPSPASPFSSLSYSFCPRTASPRS